MAHELSKLKRDCPQWRIWRGGDGYLYAVRHGVYRPGQGTTVFARTVDGLRIQIGKAEAEAGQQAQQAERLACHG